MSRRTPHPAPFRHERKPCCCTPFRRPSGDADAVEHSPPRPARGLCPPCAAEDAMDRRRSDVQRGERPPSSWWDSPSPVMRDLRMKTADESSARIVVPAAPLAASYGRRGGTRHVHRCPTEGHPALRFAPYAAASSRMANGEWRVANGECVPSRGRGPVALQTVDPAFDRGNSPRVAAGVVRFVGPHLGPV
jgi:hypothetical protein